MTDTWNFDDNTPSALRTYAESQAAENKALKDQLTQIQAELAKQRVGSVFEDLGLPKSAASLYSGDPTPDAVKAWADTVKSTFGITDANASATSNTPAVSPENVQALQAFTEAGTNAPASTTIDDWQRGVNNAGSLADLINNAAAWSR